MYYMIDFSGYCNIRNVCIKIIVGVQKYSRNTINQIQVYICDITAIYNIYFSISMLLLNTNA